MVHEGSSLAIVNDKGPENQARTMELLERFNVRTVQVAVDHAQSNGPVERRH